MSTPSTDRVNSVGTPASGSDSKTIESTKTFDNVARTVETAISPETGSYLHGHCFMNAVLNKVPPFFFFLALSAPGAPRCRLRLRLQRCTESTVCATQSACRDRFGRIRALHIRRLLESALCHAFRVAARGRCAALRQVSRRGLLHARVSAITLVAAFAAADFVVSPRCSRRCDSDPRSSGRRRLDATAPERVQRACRALLGVWRAGPHARRRVRCQAKNRRTRHVRARVAGGRRRRRRRRRRRAHLRLGRLVADGRCRALSGPTDIRSYELGLCLPGKV